MHNLFYCIVYNFNFFAVFSNLTISHPLLQVLNGRGRKYRKLKRKLFSYFRIMRQPIIGIMLWKFLLLSFSFFSLPSFSFRSAFIFFNFNPLLYYDGNIIFFLKPGEDFLLFDIEKDIRMILVVIICFFGRFS